MWVTLLLLVAVVLGLSHGRVARRDREITFGVTLLVIGYVAMSKHLL
jgi:hypothetical protein